MASGSDSEMPTRQLAIDLGLDLTTSGDLEYYCNSGGIDLFVDLGDLPISAGPTNVESLGASVSRDPPQQRDLQDCCHEPTNVKRLDRPLHDTEVLRGPSLVNERNNNQEKGTGVESDSRISTQGDPWQDWGEPLPPEESPINVNNHDHIDSDVMEKKIVRKKVTFSDVVTFFEAGNLQEERETGVSSFADLQVDQVTSNSDHNPADVSTLPSSFTDMESFNAEVMTAACLLVEMSTPQECGDSGKRDFEVLAVSQGGGECQRYDPSYDLEKLSGLVENLYADLPQLSILASKRGGDLKEDAGTWTIDVSEDSLSLKMKRVMPVRRFKKKSFSSRELASDSEEFKRPCRKRKYKSFSTL